MLPAYSPGSFPIVAYRETGASSVAAAVGLPRHFGTTDLRQDFPRPDPTTVEGFRGIWAATLADTMGRHGIMSPDIGQLVGVAATTTHRALTMLQPGDVLMLDEGDGNVTGSFGHNMSLQARNRGTVGLVTSGCILDLRLLREDRFPVFSRGVCALSAQKSTPGSVNMPVQVGGIRGVSRRHHRRRPPNSDGRPAKCIGGRLCPRIES
jgi:hypothetical protein